MQAITRFSGLALVAAGMLLLAVGVQAGPTAEQGCKSGKNKTAGKYAACRANAEAKLAASGDMSKYADALDKCETKFSAAWQNLEDKALAASAPCPAGDAAIKGRTDAYTNEVAALVAGTRFVDNGDGTVTDHETGLQWEQKTTAVGSGVNPADPHDVDNRYTWSAGVTEPDGTAFTDFLVTLNNGTSDDGVSLTGCFAGHCDWRLPTIVELQTILLDAYPCGTSPCIDPIFGSTAASSYWSSTSNASNPEDDFGWNVDFADGRAYYHIKPNTFQVRAVRGGW